MSFPSLESAGGELSALNKMLILVGIAPAMALPTDPMSDGNMALRFLRESYMEVAGRGLYCLNRVDDYEVEATVDNEFPLPATVWKAEVDKQSKQQFPELIFAKSLNKMVSRKDRTQTVFPDYKGQTLYLDAIMFPPAFEDAPPEVVDFAVLKAAIRFGSTISVTLDKLTVSTIEDAFMRCESESEPVRNLFNQGTVRQTWSR